MPKIFVKDIKDIRNSFEPEVVPQIVGVWCIAVHNNSSFNEEFYLPLSNSIPIEGYIYNNITDKYSIMCYDRMNLGSIPVAYKVKMQGVGNWHIYVPMPEPVLKRYMTSQQRRVLAQFKAKLREQGEDVRYEYIQMLSAYPYG